MTYTYFFVGMVQLMAVFSALAILAGGLTAAGIVVFSPVRPGTGDSAAGNAFFAGLIVTTSCATAMACLWIGGKVTGAL